MSEVARSHPLRSPLTSPVSSPASRLLVTYSLLTSLVSCLVPSLSPVSSPGGSGHRLSRYAFHPAPLPPVGDRAPAGRKERGKDGERRDREVTHGTKRLNVT